MGKGVSHVVHLFVCKLFSIDILFSFKIEPQFRLKIYIHSGPKGEISLNKMRGQPRLDSIGGGGGGNLFR